MSARDVIAKCTKPGCGAMRLIAKPCLDYDCPQDWTVKRLIAAGYRIVGPGEERPIPTGQDFVKALERSDVVIDEDMKPQLALKGGDNG